MPPAKLPLGLALCCLVAAVDMQGGFEVYKTEPTFKPMRINIVDYTKETHLLAPGYIFLAPRDKGNEAWGPMLFDQDGNTVWYGLASVHMLNGEYTSSTNVRACDYLGESGYICYSESHHEVKRDAVGMNRVLSPSYEPVRDYSHAGNFSHSNPHEFNMLAGGKSFMQIAYRPVNMDLSFCYGPRNGLVMDGCLEEVDTATGELIFNWCFLDHHNVWETETFPKYKENKVNQTATRGGKGTQSDPWDFMHLNAADKNEEGDYLLSGRHQDQVIKIAGLNNAQGLEPGTTIWRLGGSKTATMEFDDGQKHFSRQHHARFQGIIGENEELISLFNNAFGGDSEIAASEPRSSGLIVKINNATNRASVVKKWTHPYDEIAYAMGGIQILPNGNALIGWGTLPQFSEMGPNGTLLYHAKFEPDSGEASYRAYKHPFVGKPNSEPKLVAYCRHCYQGDNSPLMAYVSWNGATEVTQWKFYFSSTTENGPWIPVGTFEKTGFETKVDLTKFDRYVSFIPFVSVEALDKHGNILGSTISATFVPKWSINDDCDLDGCNKPMRFAYDEIFSRGERCGGSLLPSLFVLVFVIIGMESLTSLINKSVLNLVFRKDFAMRGIYNTTRSEDIPAVGIPTTNEAVTAEKVGLHRYSQSV